MDVVDRETRSRMMSGIKGRNTRAELLVRKSLFALGFRYRIHDKGLPGCPDIVFPKHRAVIFVHGCFWHGHDCELFKVPRSNTEFWNTKIGQNRNRDERNLGVLRTEGWRVCVVWECATKGRAQLDNWSNVVQKVANWLVSTADYLVIDRQLRRAGSTPKYEYAGGELEVAERAPDP